MPLLLFALLQALDLATTLRFLGLGVAEANPLVRAALQLLQPWLALLVLKLVACAAAIVAWRSGRRRLVAWANYAFAACIVWNLLAITAA